MSNKRFPKKNATSFFVGTTYTDEKEREMEERLAKWKPFTFKTIEPKTETKNLEFTHPCQFVLRKTDENGNLGDYGVCYREKCTYAHSLEEYRIKKCLYENKCKRGYDCPYIHSYETKQEYYDRTGEMVPDLPETNKDSRKPRKPFVKKSFIVDLKEEQDEEQVKEVQVNEQQVKEEQPVIEQPIETQSYDEPEINRTTGFDFFAAKKINKYKATNPHMSDAEIQNLLYTAWTELSDKKRKKYDEQAVPQVNEELIIMRVPKELAKQAMDIMLDRGITNIKLELL